MSEFPAWIERLLLPGMGYCYRCKRPWKSGHLGVEEHVTDYSPTNGCFPLCQGCWSALSPEERLPYYEQLWQSWLAAGTDKDHADHEAIRDAVAAGL